MNDQELVTAFAPLYADRDDFQDVLNNRPKFAHYTSI